MNIAIVPTAEKHITGFREALGCVCRERKYLLFTEAPPIEKVQEFIKSLINGIGVQFVAIDADENNRVIGWADVNPQMLEGLQHIGSLGMGVIPEYRGYGIGPRLLEATVTAAFEAGLLRIELDAFGTNTKAIALYEKFGFQHEGIKRKARYIDNEWDDRIMMALLKAELP